MLLEYLSSYSYCLIKDTKPDVGRKRDGGAMWTNGLVDRKAAVLKNQFKTSRKGGALKNNNLSRRRESLCLSSHGALKVRLISLTRQKWLHSTPRPRVKCDIRCSKWQRSIRCLNTVISVSAGIVTVKKVQLFSLMAIMCRGIMDWPVGQQDISKRRQHFTWYSLG